MPDYWDPDRERRGKRRRHFRCLMLCMYRILVIHLLLLTAGVLWILFILLRSR